MDCRVLLNDVALGTGAVPWRVAVDSWIPVVRVVLDASEVLEGVEVDIVV